MKILQIIFVILVCGFSFGVNAQADCIYSLRIYVRDEKGNTPKNIRVKMSRFNFNYHSQTGAFTTGSTMGTGSKYKVALQVRADGFEDFEREIIAACGFPAYEIKLKPKGTNESVVFEELAHLRGEVVDASDALIPETKVTLTDEKGRQFRTAANDNGYFSLDVPAGKYSLEFIGTDGFAPKKYENFELSKGYNDLKVKLDVIDTENCGAGGCIPSPVIENPSTEVSDKVLLRPSQNLPKEQNKSKRKNKNNQQ